MFVTPTIKCCNTPPLNNNSAAVVMSSMRHYSLLLLFRLPPTPHWISSKLATKWRWGKYISLSVTPHSLVELWSKHSLLFSALYFTELITPLSLYCLLFFFFCFNGSTKLDSLRRDTCLLRNILVIFYNSITTVESLSRHSKRKTLNKRHWQTHNRAEPRPNCEWEVVSCWQLQLMLLPQISTDRPTPERHTGIAVNHTTRAIPNCLWASDNVLSVGGWNCTERLW